MIRGFGTAREYLAEVVGLVEAMLAWQRSGTDTSEDGQRAAGELEVEIARREDRLSARVLATEVPIPFLTACDRFVLTASEREVLALLTALEVSGGEGRPAATVGLIDTLVYRGRELRDRSVEELAPDSSLFVHGLAELGASRSTPWLATPIRVAPRMVELALGRLRLDHELSRFAVLVEEPRSAAHLIISPETITTIERAVAAQLGPDAHLQPIPLLIGPEGSGRRCLASGASRALGRALLEVQAGALPREPEALAGALRAIRREATLFSAVILVRDLHVLGGDEARGEASAIPRLVDALGSHDGPIVMSAARPCWPATARRAELPIELSIPTEAERAALFERALPLDHELAARAAERYRISGGLIERATAAASVRASARGAAVELGDLRVAVRGLLDRDLATLGRLVEWRQTWDDLVLPDDIRDELRELVSRVRNRHQVLHEWGFARKVGKGTGLSALFSGPPGTGKTMVAGLLASELGLDLYQIDTSRLVSKWVGETEKNLARLFDAAAAGHAMLLFDEADSLFAKRTEVKSSNDRYANLEVNYLLQRMESFEGITILTTNLESSVDEAFRRRLAFRIAFPVPEVDERERLWRAMLPESARTSGRLEFRTLAERYEMSGGYIRNAVLRAAYLAAADKSPITQHHLQRAASLEYAAMGKIVHHTASSL